MVLRHHRHTTGHQYVREAVCRCEIPPELVEASNYQRFHFAVLDFVQQGHQPRPSCHVARRSVLRDDALRLHFQPVCSGHSQRLCRPPPFLVYAFILSLVQGRAVGYFLNSVWVLSSLVLWI